MNIVILEPTGVSADEYLRALPSHQITELDTRTYSDEALIKALSTAEVAVLTNRPLSANVLDACSKLSFISVAFTGIDHIDSKACEEHQITVKNAGAQLFFFQNQ